MFGNFSGSLRSWVRKGIYALIALAIISYMAPGTNVWHDVGNFLHIVFNGASQLYHTSTGK